MAPVANDGDRNTKHTHTLKNTQTFWLNFVVFVGVFCCCSPWYNRKTGRKTRSYLCFCCCLGGGGGGAEMKRNYIFNLFVLCQVHYLGYLLGYHASILNIVLSFVMIGSISIQSSILYIILSLVRIDSISIQFWWLIGPTVFCTMSGTK